MTKFQMLVRLAHPGTAAPCSSAPKKATASPRQGEIYELEEEEVEGVRFAARAFTSHSSYLQALKKRKEQIKHIEDRAQAREERAEARRLRRESRITRPRPLKRVDPTLAGFKPGNYNLQAVTWTLGGGVKPATSSRPSRAFPVLGALTGPSFATLSFHKEAGRSDRTLQQAKAEVSRQKAAGRLGELARVLGIWA